MNCNNCVANHQAIQAFCSQFEHGSEPCNQLVTHPESYYILLELMRSLQAQIEMRLQEMEPGAPYSLMKICGKAYWKSLTKQERHFAFTCVDFLIEYEGLPLEALGFDGKMNDYIYH